MKHRIRQCLSVLSFFILLITLIKLFEYLLVPMSRADFYLHDMARMKKQGQNIDMVIIGNSHSLYGFNPEIFEEELGYDNVYNASVAGLQISSKYYIAESIIADFDPKVLLVDIDWISLYDHGTTRTQSKLLGADRLTGIRKIRHILSDFEPSEKIYALSSLYRFRDNIFKKDTIFGNVKLKRWAAGTRYEADYYHTIKGYDKGSACSSKPYEMSSKGTFDRSLIWNHSKAYVDKLIGLCKANNIRLFFVSPPITTMQQLNIGNYQEAVEYYKALAKENNVIYYDMNMLKHRDEIFGDNSFYDAGHLCDYGASNASKICAELIRDELNGIDTEDLFYDSMEELTADITRIVAVTADVEKKDERILISNMQYTAGKDAEAVFEILLSENGTDYEIVYETARSGDSYEIRTDSVSSDKVYIKVVARDIHNRSESYVNYSVKLK